MELLHSQFDLFLNFHERKLLSVDIVSKRNRFGTMFANLPVCRYITVRSFTLKKAFVVIIFVDSLNSGEMSESSMNCVNRAVQNKNA